MIESFAAVRHDITVRRSGSVWAPAHASYMQSFFHPGRIMVRRRKKRRGECDTVVKGPLIEGLLSRSPEVDDQ